MKIEVDFTRLQNPDGSYNEAEVTTVAKLTGKSIRELMQQATAAKDHDFTREQIGKMSTEEFEKNRDAINEALAAGRIK